MVRPVPHNGLIGLHTLGAREGGARDDVLRWMDLLVFNQETNLRVDYIGGS